MGYFLLKNKSLITQVDISNPCHEATGKNCTSKPWASLKKAGISVKELCANDMGTLSSSELKGYSLNAAGKKTTYFITEKICDVSSCSTSYQIQYSAKNLCDTDY